METNSSDSPKPENNPTSQPVTIISKSANKNKRGPKEKAGKNKKATDWWETGSKILASLLTAAGLVIGVWQYQDQQQFNDSQEFRRKMWERRLDTYMEIADASAKMITAVGDKSKFDSLSIQFEHLYWGRLPIVDDTIVELRSKQLKDELESIRIGEGDTTELKKRGYRLVKACQKSLSNSWRQLYSDEK